MTETVGFVGLGAMGLGMAVNVHRAGYDVVAYDPDPVRKELAVAAGVQVVAAPREVAAAASDTVVSVVRTAGQTDDVFFGADGLATAGADRNVLVASTLDPTTMRQLAERAEAHSLHALEATMSGGPWGAADGTLTLMVAAPQPRYEALVPILDAMGRNIFHVGEVPGTAQACKLAVQLAFGINMMGVYEGLQLARRYGVDEGQLMQMLQVSVGDSWVVRNWDRVKPWWEHYVPGEDLDILLKDLRSVVREADDHLFPVPVTALTFQLMRHVWEHPEASDTQGSSTP